MSNLKVFVAAVLLTTGIAGGEQAVQKHGASNKGVRRIPAAPPYAVPMEPLVKYSQRDPLYEKRASNSSKLFDHQAEGTNNLVGYSHHHYSDRYDPYQYYSEPEPIIEIIIKESNESLPTTPRPTLASITTTKEPVQVFYIKYKKNPHKENDVIYEAPIPALTPHVSEIIENEHLATERQVEEDHVRTSPAPPTTTLRTIIRPDSEIYHGSALKITFGSEVKESSADRREETESAESTETTKGHYFKRQPPPYHSQGQPPAQFIPSNAKRIPNSQPVPLQSSQQAYRFGHLPTPNYQQRPLQFEKTATAASPFSESRLQQAYTTIPNAQNSYQTPSPAQIQQYQQHKLFLHQQNLLRHHALREHQQQSVHQQPINQASPTPPQQPSETTQKSYRGTQLNIQPAIPVHYSRQPVLHPAKEHSKPTQQYLYNQVQLTTTTERTSQYNAHVGRFGSQLRQPQQQKDTSARKPTQNFNQPSPTQYFNIGNYQKQNGAGQQYNQQSNFQTNPVALQTNPNVQQTNRNLQQTNPVALQTNPNLQQTNPTVQQTNPNLQRTNPTVQQTNPNLQRTNPTVQQTNPINYKHHSDSEIIKSISKLEDHQIEGTNKAQPAPIVHSTYRTLYQRNEQTYPSSTSRTATYRPVYSTTAKYTPNPTKTYTLLRSTTEHPKEVSYQPNTQTNKPSTGEETEKKHANLAALPDEVPDDLREQLLSSGILSNADIQILDYDKVGDVPIESLPPEALENFYAAGSAPVPAVAPPPYQESEVNEQQSNNDEESKVEMKVVRFDPTTKEGQSLAETYVQEDATHLDPVVLNDSRYNRYLPLKVDGSQFPIPDSGELQGRIVHSVVVLAPVDYDLLSGEPDRDGRASRVQGVRFLAGTALKTVVREPSKQNYEAWLEKEKATPTDRQSVVLLVTRRPGEEENGKPIEKQEIFMYDISHGKISKLKGELSSAFVQVAESNSGSDELEGLSDDPASVSSSNPA